MNATPVNEAKLVAVHVGQEPPRGPGQIAPLGAIGRRYSATLASVGWSRHGVRPCWLGAESHDCAAAVNPVLFGGDEEFRRYADGATARGEPVVVVLAVGETDPDRPHNPLASGTSVLLPDMRGQISGRPLPSGARISPAAGVTGADRDLALRLQGGPQDARWWALELQALHFEGAEGTRSSRPQGRLEPLLVDGRGDPVAAVWLPDQADQRWYLIPAGSDWDSVVDWLARQALPQFVPGALRRARSPLFHDQDLETEAEREAREQLEDLESRYLAGRARLHAALSSARAAAEPVREDLLYGTGSVLEDAVAQVLVDAGLTVTDLDELLGRPESADLLIEWSGQRRLVEVKSASGNAGESLVAALLKHLETWRELRPDLPVSGGVLVVNHQHRLDPPQRTPEVYRRREFIATLSVPVISSRQLFDWWRDRDWSAVHAAVLGQPEPSTPQVQPPGRAEPKGADQLAPDASRGAWARLFGRHT